MATDIGALNNQFSDAWNRFWEDLQGSKSAFIDWWDARRMRKREQRKARTMARIERKLKSTLRKDERFYEKRTIASLTKLGFCHITGKGKARKVTEWSVAQSLTTPLRSYVRFDTVHRPYGQQNNVLKIQEDWVVQTVAADCRVPVSVHYTPRHGLWFIYERAPGMERVEFVDALLEMPKSAGPTAVVMGFDANRRLQYEEISKMPHVLLAGQTGSGKSSHLHAMICTLLHRADPSKVKLTLLDLLGGIELNVYNGLPHLYDEAKALKIDVGDAESGGEDVDLSPEQIELLESEGDSEGDDVGGPYVEPRVYGDPEEAMVVLDRVVIEVRRRLDLLVKAGCRNVEHWNALHRSPETRLPYWVIMIDEFHNLKLGTGSAKSVRDRGERVDRLLSWIAAVSRKTGIHLVLTTQRPTVDVVTGLIKANIPARIALQVASATDSRVIIDDGEAALLDRPGQLIYRMGGTDYTAQSPYMSPALVTDVVERIKSGAPPITTQTHSVGRLEMVEWAITENEGVFDIDTVYFEFKNRGLTHRDVREAAVAFIGQMVEVAGRFYQMRRRADGSSEFYEVNDGQ